MVINKTPPLRHLGQGGLECSLISGFLTPPHFWDFCESDHGAPYLSLPTSPACPFLTIKGNSYLPAFSDLGRESTVFMKEGCYHPNILPRVEGNFSIE